MLSLSQVAQLESSGSGTQPLPEVLPVLTARGIRFEAGQMAMLVGQPNSGKSMIALWYAIEANITTFYFSADTDKRTTRYRAAAIKTGFTFNEVKEMIGTSGQGIIDDALMEITDAGIQFSFDPQPSMEDIDLELLAYEEVYGIPPELIVIDNLLNLVNDAGDFAGLLQILGELHALARMKDSALLILHHVNDSTSKPEYPASRSSIRGRVSQYPEMILSIAMVPEENQMRIACVKHRHETPSPDGSNYETIFVDPTRMTFFNSRSDLSSADKEREWA